MNMKAEIKAVVSLRRSLIPGGEQEAADYSKAPPANAHLGLCKCGGFPSRRLQSFQDGIRSEPKEGRSRRIQRGEVERRERGEGGAVGEATPGRRAALA